MEYPIIFTAEMIRAIIANKKSQTRRVKRSGYAIGDVLWVKESYRLKLKYDKYKPSEVPQGAGVDYCADNKSKFLGKRRPSIFMCRWMSRITLEITSLRTEKLQIISAYDCILEGLRTTLRGYHAQCHLIGKYHSLWEKINGEKYPWETNPEVNVIGFKVINGR